ncbi:FliH/SctL family protein [Cobetia marina]|uniref:FliH/SctL family protein n=1 Tax=Cobetia marina TaxID=28258 RepID=UPI00174B477A
MSDHLTSSADDGWQPLELESLDTALEARPDATGTRQASTRQTGAGTSPDAELLRRMTQRARATLEAQRRQLEQAAHEAGYAAGEAAGYQAGLERARQQAQAQAEQQDKAARQALAEQLAQVTPLVHHLQQSLTCLEEQIGDELAALAVSVGRHLAREAFRAHPEHVVESVRSLLAADPPLLGRPRLYLNPADLPRVEQAMGAELARLGWQCLPDASLSVGGCRAEADSGCHDASLESRLALLSRQLRKRAAPTDDTTAGARILHLEPSLQEPPENAFAPSPAAPAASSLSSDTLGRLPS